jgi:hypothetical protein
MPIRDAFERSFYMKHLPCFEANKASARTKGFTLVELSAGQPAAVSSNDSGHDWFA